MKDNKVNSNNKKQSNVLNYAVVMIICVIIVIIIAAMADDRENQIDNRIIETERANESIQNEVVNLKDENYKLSKENEKNVAVISENEKYLIELEKLTEIWNLINSNDIEGSIVMLTQIDTNLFDEKLMGYYSALCKIVDIDPTAN